jgi:hypothetical protein
VQVVRLREGGSLGVVEPDDEGYLVEQRDREEYELDAPISGEHPDEADDQVCHEADGIFDSEGVQVGGAFEGGVDDVGDEGGGEKAEEPSAAREEVVFVARVVKQVGRKEEGAERVEEDCVKGYEEIDGEGPLRDEGETELPPPEVDYRQKERDCPSEMEEGDFGSTRMLNEASESVEEGRDAKADDDGDDDPYMRENVGARLRGGHGEGFHLIGLASVMRKNSNSVSDEVAFRDCGVDPRGVDL